MIQVAQSLADSDPDNVDAYRPVALNNSDNLSAAWWPAWENAFDNMGTEELELGMNFAQFNISLANQLNVVSEQKKTAAGCWELILQYRRDMRKPEPRLTPQVSLLRMLMIKKRN